MKKKDIEHLIIDFLDGRMSSEQEKEFLNIIKQQGYDVNDIKEMASINSQLNDYPVPEPGENLDNNFYNMLEHFKYEEKMKHNWLKEIFTFITMTINYKIAFKPVYVVVIILLSFALGVWTSTGIIHDNKISSMSAEIIEMREVMMLALLEQSSASERIKAVSLTNELNKVDKKIIYALIKTLNSDPNINVRLVTIETLAKYADNPVVRKELIKSITIQESPLVQIALADIMVVLQEKKSVREFNKLLEKKDLNDAVRSKVLKRIEILI